MPYRGNTWPQIGDQVHVVESGLVGRVEDITGQGLNERFVLSILTAGTRVGRGSYALKDLRRVEPTPIDRQPQSYVT